MPGTLAARGRAIVTVKTNFGTDLRRGVGKLRGDPRVGAMTDIARLGGNEVRRAFAACNPAVVTARAGTNHLSMVNR